MATASKLYNVQDVFLLCVFLASLYEVFLNRPSRLHLLKLLLRGPTFSVRVCGWGGGARALVVVSATPTLS